MNQGKKFILSLAFVVMLGGVAIAPEHGSFVKQAVAAPPPPLEQYKGTKVSYYGRPGLDHFYGRKTANGERLTYPSRIAPHLPTVAHKALPFNTLVRFRNPNSGAVITARVNDRGPFVKGRMFDLSWDAARQLGIEREGVVELQYAVIGKYQPQG